MTEQELLEKHQNERTACEVWTRVMGYFRPFSGFNKGKQSEFKDRVWFTEQNINKDSQRKAA